MRDDVAVEEAANPPSWRMPGGRNFPPRVHMLDPGNFTPAYDVNLSTALMARGWDVEWITSRHEFEDPAPRSGFTVTHAFFGALHREPTRSWFGLRRRSKLRRLLKALWYPIELRRLEARLLREAPGLLHVQWALMPRFDARCWRSLRARGWRTVHTVHDPSSLDGSMPRLTSPTTPLLRAADALIVHGGGARTEVIDRQADPRRVFCIPLGSTLRCTEAERPDRQQARRTHGIADSVPVVLFFGYVKPYKGLDVLLRSIARVKTALPDVLLLVAGEVLGGRTGYRRTIRKLGLTSNVRWTDGYVPERLVPTYLAACNVVAVPYLKASSSAVLVSAQSAGRAVIASDVGDLREVIEPGRTGVLVGSGDVEALAAGLVDLLADPGGADRMGQAASAVARVERSWDVVARQVADVYERAWQDSLQ